MIANISFYRPFAVSTSPGMNIDYKKKNYKMILNWGVFNSTLDTN